VVRNYYYYYNNNNNKGTYYLSTDASDICLGAILSQGEVVKGKS